MREKDKVQNMDAFEQQGVFDMSKILFYSKIGLIIIALIYFTVFKLKYYYVEENEEEKMKKSFFGTFIRRFIEPF